MTASVTVWAILFAPVVLGLIAGGGMWAWASRAGDVEATANRFKLFGQAVVPAITVLVALWAWFATPAADRAALFGGAPLEAKSLLAALGFGAAFAGLAAAISARALRRAPETRAFLASDVRELPSLALVAPVGEELIFRGYGAYAFSDWALWQAALLTSAAFALMHFRPTMIALSFAFGLGLFALDRWSGTLLAPIIAHLAANLIVWLWMRRAAGPTPSVSE